MSDEQNDNLKKKGTVREYVESLGLAILVALTIRAFGIEAFKIPSGSMIPTLSIGDHIFVNKFIYGLRIPFTKYKFIKVHEPKRGEVIVFIYPVDEKKDFIKRVIGMPGDRIHIDGENIWVNGELLKKNKLIISPIPDDERRLSVKNGIYKTIPFENDWVHYNFYDEHIGDINHLTQYTSFTERQPLDILVPSGKYFVMGDNRDNSADSREWGFVPEENIKGKAMFVWLSLDKDNFGIRWREFGRWIE